MTDAEIAEFMGWSQQADRMRDNPDSIVSLVYRLVAEVRRRERQALGGDDTRVDLHLPEPRLHRSEPQLHPSEPSLNRLEPGLEPRLNRFEPFLNRSEPPDGGDR